MNGHLTKFNFQVFGTCPENSTDLLGIAEVTEFQSQHSTKSFPYGRKLSLVRERTTFNYYSQTLLRTVPGCSSWYDSGCSSQLMTLWCFQTAKTHLVFMKSVFLKKITELRKKGIVFSDELRVYLMVRSRDSVWVSQL